jgi:hypothetical protein
MTTIKTAVRDLEPGARIVSPIPGEPVFVVLCAAAANPGPVGLQLGRLGEIPPHISRVATVAWQPDAVVDVAVDSPLLLEQALAALTWAHHAHRESPQYQAIARDKVAAALERARAAGVLPPLAPH